MATEYKSTQVVNDRPRPRVLVYQNIPRVIDFAWVKEQFETVRYVNSLDEVDLTEWDLLVTDEVISAPLTQQRRQRLIPSGMYTFEVQPRRNVVTFTLDGRETDKDGVIVGPKVRWARDIAGSRLYRVDGLPEPLQDLVQSDLVSAASARAFQSGLLVPEKVVELAPTITEFRPFLTGPNGLVLAASYKRRGGSHHWILPGDVTLLKDWLDVAINEWHLSNPRRFPSSNSWQTADTWMTAAERQINDQLTTERSRFRDTADEFQVVETRLLEDLESARTGAGTGLRALLTEQDDLLQVAVKDALVELGFQVRDMDLEWPDDARREDYRLTDASDPSWLALADATGTANGAKLSKFSALQGHSTAFVLAERPSAVPDLWLIVNQLRYRDPESRGDLFREDEARIIAAANGLIIDSTAIFSILRAGLDSDRRAAVRGWMRSLRGQLTLEMARSWLLENSPGVVVAP